MIIPSLIFYLGFAKFQQNSIKHFFYLFFIILTLSKIFNPNLSKICIILYIFSQWSNHSRELPSFHCYDAVCQVWNLLWKYKIFWRNVKRFYRQQYNAELFYLRYKAMRLPIVCAEDLWKLCVFFLGECDYLCDNTFLLW